MFNSKLKDLTTMISPNPKFALVGLFSLVLFGCATSQQSVKEPDQEQVEQPAGETGDQTPEGTAEQTPEQIAAAQAQQAEQQKVALLTAKPDPMKDVVAPLELIKGYDQVKAFVDSKNTNKAIEHLSQLQMAHQKYSGPSYRLARLYFEQKNYVEALEAVETAISINGENYFAHNLKGVVLREQGEFDKAKQAYLKAESIYPAHPKTHLNLAILSDIYLYDLASALESYENYMRLVKEDKKVSGWIVDLKRRIARSAN